jgi:hypothetical protein
VRALVKTLAGSFSWDAFQWLYTGGHGCGFQDFPLFGLSAYKQRFYFDFSPSLVGVGNCRNEIQISTLWTKNLYANGTGKNMASRWNIAFEI